MILGGPGSGKTWLAKRTARCCAEEALAALEEGTALDDVELPLYTTCARLVSAPGDIRDAAVSSAIERIGDLGGFRIIQALWQLFTERDRRTLLVIDSLDEAPDAGDRDRLREADSLKPPWRVVLTSRRSSWNSQLNIEDANPAHRVGELQPLRYPEDVEPVIQQWFADQPEHGQALAAQIAAAAQPAAGRDRAADPGLLLHPRRRQAAATRVQARSVQARHQPHALRSLALRQQPPAGPGRLPGNASDLGLAGGEEPPGLRRRAVGRRHPYQASPAEPCRAGCGRSHRRTPWRSRLRHR